MSGRVFNTETGRSARVVRESGTRRCVEETFRRENEPGIYTCPCCGEHLSGPARFYTCPGPAPAPRDAVQMLEAA
jgi:peptide methionine sulfoxide reductase MsrB